jgi:hypothetical protein
MIYRVFPMAALALALFICAPVPAAAKDTDVSTHDGKVSSITGDELVMIGKDGKKHTHPWAADAKATCDGKICKCEDLKAGMKIRVTTNDDDKKAVINIDAIDKSDDFQKRDE